MVLVYCDMTRSTVIMGLGVRVQVLGCVLKAQAAWRCP